MGAGGVTSENEQFVLGNDGRIRVKSNREMCMNVKGAEMNVEGQIVLYSCGADSDHAHDIFEYKDDAITLKGKPELHFNVKGGDLQKSSEVVLYNCHAHPHELFEFENDQIKVPGTNLCLHSEGGLGPGQRIILW